MISHDEPSFMNSDCQVTSPEQSLQMSKMLSAVSLPVRVHHMKLTEDDPVED